MTSRRLVLAFATTVRVVDRVHNRTTDGRADALPAVTASLADLDVGMLGVADFANSRAAGEQHAAHLRRGHAQNGVLAFLTHELDRSTSGASQRSTLAGLQLNCMDEGTNRDVSQSKRVAGLNVGLRARHNHVADLQAFRVKDVALLAINVMEKSDTGGTVRVVLDGSDLGGDAVLVALEVDDTVTTLHAAALMTGGDATLVVATGLLRQRRKQRLLGLRAGDFGEIRNRLEAATSAGRLVLLDSHQTTFLPWKPARVPLHARTRRSTYISGTIAE